MLLLNASIIYHWIPEWHTCMTLLTLGEVRKWAVNELVDRLKARRWIKACSVGWFVSLLVREEVLLVGLCERKILFRLEIYDRLRQATAKRTGCHLKYLLYTVGIRRKGWVKVMDWDSFQTGNFYQVYCSCLFFWWPVTILKLRGRTAMSIHSFLTMLMHLHASYKKNGGTRFRTLSYGKSQCWMLAKQRTSTAFGFALLHCSKTFICV